MIVACRFARNGIAARTNLATDAAPPAWKLKAVSFAAYSWTASPPLAVSIARSIFGAKLSGSVRTVPSAETTRAPPSRLPRPRPDPSLIRKLIWSKRRSFGSIQRNCPSGTSTTISVGTRPVAQVLVSPGGGAGPGGLGTDHRHEARRLDLIRLQAGSVVDLPDSIRQLPVVRAVPGLSEVVGVV